MDSLGADLDLDQMLTADLAKIGATSATQEEASTQISKVVSTEGVKLEEEMKRVAEKFKQSREHLRQDGPLRTSGKKPLSARSGSNMSNRQRSHSGRGGQKQKRSRSRSNTVMSVASSTANKNPMITLENQQERGLQAKRKSLGPYGEAEASASATASKPDDHILVELRSSPSAGQLVNTPIDSRPQANSSLLQFSQSYERHLPPSGRQNNSSLGQAQIQAQLSNLQINTHRSSQQSADGSLLPNGLLSSRGPQLSEKQQSIEMFNLTSGSFFGPAGAGTASGAFGAGPNLSPDHALLIKDIVGEYSAFHADRLKKIELELTEMLRLDGTRGQGQLLHQMAQSEVTAQFGKDRLKEVVNAVLVSEQEATISDLSKRLSAMGQQYSQAIKQLQQAESDKRASSSELETLASKWKSLQNQFEEELRRTKTRQTDLEEQLQVKEREVLQLQEETLSKSSKLRQFTESVEFEARQKDEKIKALEAKIEKKKLKLNDLQLKYDKAQAIALQDPLKQQVIDDLERERQVLNDKLAKLQKQSSDFSAQLDNQALEAKKEKDLALQMKDLQLKELDDRVQQQVAKISEGQQALAQCELRHKEELFRQYTKQQEVERSFDKQVRDYQEKMIEQHRSEVKSLISESQQALTEIQKQNDERVQQIKEELDQVFLDEKEKWQEHTGELKDRIKELESTLRSAEQRSEVLEKACNKERSDYAVREAAYSRETIELKNEVSKQKETITHLEHILDEMEEELKQKHFETSSQQKAIQDNEKIIDLLKRRSKAELGRALAALQLLKQDYLRFREDVKRDFESEASIREEVKGLLTVKVGYILKEKLGTELQKIKAKEEEARAHLEKRLETTHSQLKSAEDRNSQLTSINNNTVTDLESMKKVLDSQRQKIELLQSDLSMKQAELLKIEKEMSEKMILKETTAIMERDAYEAQLSERTQSSKIALEQQEKQMRDEYKKKLADILHKIEKKQAQFDSVIREKDSRLREQNETIQILEYQMKQIMGQLEETQAKACFKF